MMTEHQLGIEIQLHIKKGHSKLVNEWKWWKFRENIPMTTTETAGDECVDHKLMLFLNIFVQMSKNS